MFCSKCGSQVADGVKFCQNCGTEVQGANPQGTTQQMNMGNNYNTYAGANNSTSAGANIMGQVGKFAQSIDKNVVNLGGINFSMLQIVLYAASLLNIISYFLPFAVAEGWGISESVSWFDSINIAVMILAIICILGTCALSFLNMKLFSMIPAGVNFLFVLICIIANAGDVGYYGFGVSAGFGIGAWLGLLMALVVTVAAVLGFFSDKNKNR